MRSAESHAGKVQDREAGMKAQTQTFEIHHVAELGQVRCDLDRSFATCSLPANLRYDLLTCVQEACENALRFAATPRGVHVSVTVGVVDVVVTVRDHGTGLDLERLTDPPPDPLSESGRGLFLLRALMDEVEFRVEEGTEVRLRRRRPKRAAARRAA